jgi:hypothetical protein
MWEGSGREACPYPDSLEVALGGRQQLLTLVSSGANFA